LARAVVFPHIAQTVGSDLHGGRLVWLARAGVAIIWLLVNQRTRTATVVAITLIGITFEGELFGVYWLKSILLGRVISSSSALPAVPDSTGPVCPPPGRTYRLVQPPMIGLGVRLVVARRQAHAE
jgi:hypothetical protein